MSKNATPSVNSDGQDESIDSGLQIDDGVSRRRILGAAADYLWLMMDQVNEANLGATVELGTEELRSPCNDSGVRVETAAGIEVKLLPAQPGETNTGP